MFLDGIVSQHSLVKKFLCQNFRLKLSFLTVGRRHVEKEIKAEQAPSMEQLRKDIQEVFLPFLLFSFLPLSPFKLLPIQEAKLPGT